MMKYRPLYIGKGMMTEQAQQARLSSQPSQDITSQSSPHNNTNQCQLSQTIQTDMTSPSKTNQTDMTYNNITDMTSTLWYCNRGVGVGCVNV